MIFLSLQNYSISPKYCHQYPKKCRSCPKLAYFPSFFPLFSTKSPLFVISFLFFFSSLSVFHILAFAVLSLFFYCKMRWCLPCHCSKRFRRFATSRVLPALSPFKNTLFSAISPSQTSQNRIKSLSLPQKRKVLCD